MDSFAHKFFEATSQIMPTQNINKEYIREGNSK